MALLFHFNGLNMYRLIFLLVITLFVHSLAIGQATLTIPPQQRVALDYPDYEVYRATVKNRSRQTLEVAVLTKADQVQLRGFGLAPKGKATVTVEQTSQLIIDNPGNQAATIRLTIAEEAPPAPTPSRDYVDFVLQNSSANSIPLLIPSVMNPNLSPFSKSAVSLKIGQEILFRENGRKYVLLTVDDSIQDGEVLDVAKLLSARKKELGL